MEEERMEGVFRSLRLAVKVFLIAAAALALAWAGEALMANGTDEHQPFPWITAGVASGQDSLLCYAEEEPDPDFDKVIYWDPIDQENKELPRSRYVRLGNDVETNVLDHEWYIIRRGENVRVDQRAEVIGSEESHGTVNIIIMNGGSAGFPNGIHVPSGKTLNIFAQGTDRDKWGSITTSASAGNAGIGGNASTASKADNCGKINIYGGIVNSQGGPQGAGIGGGKGVILLDDSHHGDAGKITIYGGWITAKGGKSAAGVGGGYFSDGADLTIEGGTLEARGGEEGGSGIGGGVNLVSMNSIASYGRVGKLTINGGVVRAFGTGGGAGIGAGAAGNATAPTEWINITGGSVYASGSSGAAGIGGALYDIGDSTHLFGAGRTLG